MAWWNRWKVQKSWPTEDSRWLCVSVEIENGWCTETWIRKTATNDGEGNATKKVSTAMKKGKKSTAMKNDNAMKKSAAMKKGNAKKKSTAMKKGK